jgi:hypothetical protein
MVNERHPLLKESQEGEVAYPKPELQIGDLAWLYYKEIKILPDEGN